jgi:MoaA/NifB/PqqE/SkfB family radical SAM enzyme
MSRYSDLLHLLRAAKPGTDFWMNTSGFLLDFDKAVALKSAGLTGCIISLDHFRASEHNQFRKNPNAFNWATEAVKAVVKAGMPVTLSLCATREFISKENLIAYAEMARDLGVTFIQILEPKATGFYQGKDVKLDKQQKVLLEEFYWKMTFDPEYRDWPIVSYHEYHKPAINCGGAGDRFMYVNSMGQIQACPFCEKSFGNILDGHHHDGIEKMKLMGCPDLK